MGMSFAFLSRFKLYWVDVTGEPLAIDSEFAQAFIDRSLRIEQRDEWKTKGRGAQFASGGVPIGPRDFNPAAIRVHFTGVARGIKKNELLYALDTDGAGGFFAYDVKKRKERRLFHKSHFRARDLSKDPHSEQLACSLQYPNGTANLVLVNREGTNFEELTEGDSVDESPAWCENEKDMIVFQSAGIGRSSQGIAIGLAPYTLERLNLKTKQIETLVSSERYDYLAPRMTAKGHLFYIRRPYEPVSSRNYSFVDMLKDILFFPFRLLRTLFHFLNYISMAFSGKTLTTAGGPKRKSEDVDKLLLWGKWVETDKTLRQMGEENPPSLVPASWQLIQRRIDGLEEVLVRNVIAYDLLADGSILYSTGTAVFLRTPDGVQKRLLKGKLIEQVMALTPA